MCAFVVGLIFNAEDNTFQSNSITSFMNNPGKLISIRTPAFTASEDE